MQPVNRKVREMLRADLWITQAQRIQPGAHKFISALMAVVIIVSAVLLSAIPSATIAANTNVLANGGFESGFSSQAGSGTVGNGWYGFSNGGPVNYAFYDDQWAPTVAEGSHSQGIGINTRGIEEKAEDRYAGIYQTVRVTDWAEYTLNLQGLIRSTRLDGDPYRYVVQVGWTWGPQPNWNAVTNWQDANWYTYYDLENPGALSQFSTNFKAEQSYATVYVRVWKKWWAPEEEVVFNLDAITLTGPAANYNYQQSAAPNTGGALPGFDPNLSNVPAANQAGQVNTPVNAACAAGEMVYNGGFELGFNPVTAGNVGRGWGYFTNGGAANFGFFNDQWPAVVAEGRSSQLISINTNDRWPSDGDRFAGIFQQIGRLVPGSTYEMNLRGVLRGDGGDTSDSYRFTAEWGYTSNGSTDWTQVTNWQNLDLGTIFPRSEPGAIASATAQLVAPSSTIVLFVRGWSKWPIPDQEFNLNVDAISLRGCGGATPPPTQPSNCVYVVRAGDTLSQIARNAATTVTILMQLNGITNPNIIFVGQRISLPNCASPNPSPAPTPPPATRTYVVQAGDTLSNIARACGTTVANLAYINGIRNPNLIFVGQILKIP